MAEEILPPYGIFLLFYGLAAAENVEYKLMRKSIKVSNEQKKVLRKTFCKNYTKI